MSRQIIYPGTFRDAITDTNIAPGSRLLLRGGTYTTPNLAVSIHGTEEAPITIEPYDSEPVIIKPVGGIRCLTMQNANTAYITLNNLIFDASDVGSVDDWVGEGIKITSGAHDISVTNCEIRNAVRHLINISTESTGNILIDGCKLHDNGQGDMDHAIYPSAVSHLIVRNTEIYNSLGYGIHFYGSSVTAEVYHNYIHNVATGIGMFTNGNVLAYNNVIRHCSLTGLRFCYGPGTFRGYYNSVTNCLFTGIEIASIYDDGCNLIDLANNLVLDCERGVFAENVGSPTPLEVIQLRNNLVTDNVRVNILVRDNCLPHFVISNNLQAVGFEPCSDDTADILIPQTGNPSIGAGIAIDDVSLDYGGNARPNPPSIGAYEPE